MKKIVKKPDGTEEVVEGTAEEIAAYEKSLRERGEITEGGQGNRRILNEGELEQVRKIVAEEIRKAFPWLEKLTTLPSIPKIDPIPTIPWDPPPVRPYPYQPDIWFKTDPHTGDFVHRPFYITLEDGTEIACNAN